MLQSSTKNKGEGRVLFVDDEQGIRKAMTFLLRQNGYEVVEAEDGQQAMHLLNAGDNPLMVDCILCDLKMPNVNGSEAIAYFRREFPSVPIVVLTGIPDVQLAVEFMKNGVREYLVKPVEKAKLLSVLNKAVGERAVLNN